MVVDRKSVFKTFDGDIYIRKAANESLFTECCRLGLPLPRSPGKAGSTVHARDRLSPE